MNFVTIHYSGDVKYHLNQKDNIYLNFFKLKLIL